MKTTPKHESDDPGREEGHYEETHKPHKKLDDEEGCHCYDGTYPAGPLPPGPVLKKIELEEETEEQKKKDSEKDKKGKKGGKGGDGIDKAMQILDEYYEGVPLRNPNFDHGGED